MCAYVCTICAYMCACIFAHTTELTDRPSEQMIWVNKFSSGL